MMSLAIQKAEYAATLAASGILLRSANEEAVSAVSEYEVAAAAFAAAARYIPNHKTAEDAEEAAIRTKTFSEEAIMKAFDLAGCGPEAYMRGVRREYPFDSIIRYSSPKTLFKAAMFLKEENPVVAIHLFAATSGNKASQQGFLDYGSLLGINDESVVGMLKENGWVE